MQLGNLASLFEYEFVTQIAFLLSKLEQKLSEKWLLGQSGVIVHHGCTQLPICGIVDWKLIFTYQFSLLFGRKAVNCLA